MDSPGRQEAERAKARQGQSKTEKLPVVTCSADVGDLKKKRQGLPVDLADSNESAKYNFFVLSHLSTRRSTPFPPILPTVQGVEGDG